jgi:hypothetical protein
LKHAFDTQFFSKKAKDRLNDKHSYFGRRGNTVPDTFFVTQDYIGNPKKIAKYAKYALRDDGPSVWDIPPPKG